jgi:hypothetical protein
MIKKGLHIIFPFQFVFLFVLLQLEITIKLIVLCYSAATVFIAGKPISLSFSSTSKLQTKIVFNTYLMEKRCWIHKIATDKLPFKNPSHGCLKTGVLSQYLIQDETKFC